MSLKILFICARHPEKSNVKDGEATLTRSNFRCLKEIGEIEVISILPDSTSILRKILRLFFLPFSYAGGLLPWSQKSVCKKAKEKDWDVIFIDNSNYGKLVRPLRKSNPNAHLCVHFHNVEKDYALKSIHAPSFIRTMISASAAFNERVATSYADTIIALSDIDSKKIDKYYARPADYVIPICLDAPKTAVKDLQNTTAENYLLYCGSLFPPNVEGITWFINEVLPTLDIQLIIAGFQMELVNLPPSPKVRNLGTADDLTLLYNNALAVINPVFTGEGMKTKTIEALKFGKAIFATSEGWRGIELPNNLPLYHCDTAEDFITTIAEHIQKTNLITFSKIGDFFSQNFSENKKILLLSKIFSSRPP